MVDGQEARYRVDSFHAISLEGNPLQSPEDREIHIYLPPQYYNDTQQAYPVVYFLHGYAGNSTAVTIGREPNKYGKVLPREILEEISADRLTGYTMLDRLIEAGQLPPFILVQPDASLHLPHSSGVKDMFTGQTATKGSFYINSPFTGRYEDYIVQDIVNYMEANYRTPGGPAQRALAGASMGGYGALSICLNHPGHFAAVAALSPANFTVDSINWKLYVPVVGRLVGREYAETSGAANWADILDTVDLAYSGDRRLLPTVKMGPGGRVESWDEKAAELWEKHNLNSLIQVQPAPYRDMAVFISCHKEDEFGLAPEAVKLHDSLSAVCVQHHYSLYADAAATLSPHMLGIAYQIGPALRFCLEHISLRKAG